MRKHNPLKPEFQESLLTVGFAINIISVSLFLFLLTPMAFAGEAIKKSPNDDRSYRSLVLPNRLEVLLISDPKADMASASLAVSVGQSHDPFDRQGLAHFLEHMLFLGTEKYPDTEEFGKYLSEHGGFSNAFTGLDRTNYFFNVQKDYLKGALDRFAQFFIAPLFDPEFVQRELNAVDSEHQKNLMDDWRRMYQIMKTTANPKHPFSKFSTGSIKSLKKNDSDYGNIRDDLIAFYKEHYSANRMKLVVLGKENLDELENYVRAYFLEIENRDLKEVANPIPIIEKELLPRKISIEPVKEIRLLKLEFPTPPQHLYYHSKPDTLLSQLMGDEGKGSILSYLKSKGWASELSAGGGIGDKNFSFFDVTVTLTIEGIRHQDEIIQSVFNYIDLIRKEQSLERYFKELKKMAELNFQYKEKEEPSGYVSLLSSELFDVPVKEVLISRYLYDRYDHDKTWDLLGYLRPDNLQVLYASPEVKGSQTEKWYQSRYRIDKISIDQQKKWAKSINKELFLPKPNRFIPEKITLKSKFLDRETPFLIRDKPLLRVWFKKDNQFKVPKGNVQLKISTAKAYDSIENAVMTHLYTRLLDEKLNEFSYPARMAGLNYSISNSVKGLDLAFGGYAENLGTLFEKVIDTMNHLELDQNKFDIAKNKFLEDRKNRKLSKSFHLAMYETYYLLSETIWHDDEYIEAIGHVRFKQLKDFIPKLLKGLKIEMFAHGNFSTGEINKLADYLEKTWDINQATSPEITERLLVMNQGEKLNYRFKVKDNNSTILLYHQAGKSDPRKKVLLDFLSTVMEKPFYNQLRTVEQLGYLVWSGDREQFQVGGFFFLIQSSSKDPGFLRERIEKFQKGFEQKIDSLTQKEFDRFKDSLIEKRRQKPKNLYEETMKYWNSIEDESYDFEFLEKEIAQLEKLTLGDLKKMYGKLFINPETANQLSVYAIGNGHELNGEKNDFIKDVKSFKKSKDFYPNPKGKLNKALYLK